MESVSVGGRTVERHLVGTTWRFRDAVTRGDVTGEAAAAAAAEFELAHEEALLEAEFERYKNEELDRAVAEDFRDERWAA